DDSITAALSRTADVDRFRDIISHYVEHYDVPEVDVAAALALVAQGEQPLLLSAEDERFLREEFKGGDRGPTKGGRGERSDSGRGPRRGAASGPMVTYRIEVGKRHKVEPRQIVGAIANEGGLT